MQTIERYVKIAELWNEGVPAKEIAKQVGTSKGYVYLCRNKLAEKGIPMESRKSPIAQAVEILTNKK